MGEIIRVSFNQEQKNDEIDRNGINHIRHIINTEIATFIGDNELVSFNHYNLYAYVFNGIYSNMLADFDDIIDDLEYANLEYALSLFKQNTDKYRGEIQEILEDFIKRV